jgi:hypothetical protein
VPPLALATDGPWIIFNTSIHPSLTYLLVCHTLSVIGMASCVFTSSTSYLNSIIHMNHFSLSKQIKWGSGRSHDLWLLWLRLSDRHSFWMHPSIHHTSLLIYHTLSVISTASCGSTSSYTSYRNNIVHRTLFSLSCQTKCGARRSLDLWLLWLRLPVDHHSFSTHPSTHHSHLSWSVTLRAWLVRLLAALPPPTPCTIITLLIGVISLSLS